MSATGAVVMTNLYVTTNLYVIMDGEGFTHGIVEAKSSHYAVRKFCEETPTNGTSFGSLEAKLLRFSKNGVALV